MPATLRDVNCRTSLRIYRCWDRAYLKDIRKIIKLSLLINWKDGIGMSLPKLDKQIWSRARELRGIRRPIADYYYLDKEAIRNYYSKLTGATGSPMYDIMGAGINFAASAETSRYSTISEMFLFELIEPFMRKEHPFMDVPKGPDSVWTQGCIKPLEGQKGMEVKFECMDRHSEYVLALREGGKIYPFANLTPQDTYEEFVEMLCYVPNYSRKSSKRSYEILIPCIIIRSSKKKKNG